MKYIIFTCSLICVILGVKLLYYLYKPEPQLTIKFNQSYTGRVIPIEQDLTKYHCIELNRLNGGKLKFCTLRQKMDATSTPRVMGQYNKLSDVILLDKDSPNDRILHELGHQLLAQYKQGRNEEEIVQENQMFYLKLLAEKNIVCNN